MGKLLGMTRFSRDEVRVIQHSNTSSETPARLLARSDTGSPTLLSLAERSSNKRQSSSNTGGRKRKAATGRSDSGCYCYYICVSFWCCFVDVESETLREDIFPSANSMTR